MKQQFSANHFFFHPHNPWGAPPPHTHTPSWSSQLYSPWHYFWLRCSIYSRTPWSTCLKWESSHLIAPTAAEKKRERKRKKEKKGGAETGLVLMTDNPVTNSWSSSKGWLSRLWLCDVNGTWSSGSAEAQRKGSQFSLRLPQTCPQLWYSSTHFDSKLSGLLSHFAFFFLINEWIDWFCLWLVYITTKRSYCSSVLSNRNLD